MPTALLQDDAARVFADPDSFATTLLYLFFDRYVLADNRAMNEEEEAQDDNGPLDWLPETIRHEIRADYGVEIPPTNLKKLAAAISITTTDAFFVKPDVFVQLANSLANSDPILTEFEPADAEECAWAVFESLILCQDGDEPPWSPEVATYIAKAIEADGLTHAPKTLRQFYAGTQPALLDDPVLAEASLLGQKESVEAIDAEVVALARRLQQQLERVPLKRGTTKPLVDKLRKLDAA